MHVGARRGGAGRPVPAARPWGRPLVVATVVLALPLATLALSVPVSATGSTPSTTTLGSSPASPSGLGVAVTYTATVAPTSGTGATPTGTVDFTDGGTTVTGCGAATLTPTTGSSASETCVEAASAMSGGNHTVVATYGGDAIYATSNTTLTQTVTADTTATVVTSSPVSPSPFGVAVTYTATVTAGSGETTFTPAGTVAFVDGTTTLCAAASLSGLSAGAAQATCLEAGSAMTVGNHPVTATYTPSTSPTNFTTSNGPLTQTVDTDATTTVVTASPTSPSALGVAVTYTVTVTAENATTTDPTGAVSVSDGSTPLTCSALSGSGGVVTSTCTEPGTAMTAGSHTITATYDGDANFATSTDTITQTVTPATTATVVTSTTGTPSPAGQPVTYLATVTPSADPFALTGTVAFKDGATTIAGCSALSVSAGGGGATASCTEAAASMTVGTHTITAVYSGDPNYTTSTSTAFSQVVVADATTVAVMSTANPSTGGLTVTYTATVSATGGSAFTPTGTVTFTDGSTTVCAAVALSSASARCVEPAASMTSGTHPISAVYSGDPNFTRSTGLLSQVVDPAPVSISESATPASPSGLGIGVAYTITLTAGNSSAFVPGVTGTPPASSLTVTDTPPGSSTPVTLCTLATPFSTGSSAGAGVSTWECAEPAADMTAGTHTIGVSFAGDSYFGPATGSFTQDVAFHPTGSTTTVTSPGSPSYPGQAVTYTASVSGDALFAPAGSVTFYSGATAIAGCSAVVASSSANNASTYRCTEPGIDLPTGTQTIHAVFAGDSNYGPSTSANITQVVSQGATSVTVGDAAGSTNPSAAGVPVTYLATVAPSQPTAIEPTGTVTFFDGQTAICTTVALTPGATSSTATCTESSAAMTLGLHPTAAIYSGDSNYVASDNTGSPFAQQVVVNTTATAVAGPGPGTYPAGMPLPFTATVTASGAGNVLTPTGTVTFSDPSGQLCAGATLTPSTPGVATASCTFSSPDFTVGPTDTVTATYGGDANYTTSHGSTGVPAFVQATPNVTVVSATADHPTIGNASTVGLPVTYTATFADPSGGLVTPTGTVTFKDGGTTICTTALSPSSAGTATATCVNSPSVVGPHTISVVYAGDTNFTSSVVQTPNPFVQHVVTPNTSIALTAPTPANPDTTPVNTQIYPVWTPVTLQATVTGGPGGSGSLTSGGDGSVTFYLNGVAINPADFPHSPLPVPNCTGLSLTSVGTPPSATISCPAFPMPTGNDTFTAAYLDTSGASGYATVLTPTAYTWQVVAYSTNTQITASPAAPVTGQPVIVTATVTPASGAAALPTGTLAFTVNGLAVSCASPATLNGANPPQATCTLTGGLPGGGDVIQASYPGDVATAGSGGLDGWYAGSTGSLGLAVGKAPTTVKGFTVVPASGSGTPVSGQTLKFSVTSVAAVAPGAGQPTGTVAVTTPSTFQTLCTITLVNGAGSCFSSVQVPSGSGVAFTATYSGDSGFQPSTATTSLAVGAEKALVTGFTTSPTPLVYGQPVTFAVTLSPEFAGTFATGSIAITSAETGAQTLCTITLVTSSANTGTCTFTPTPSTGFIGAGAAQFTATYSGDANFATGTTGQTTAFVNKSTATVGVTVNPQNPVYGQYPSFGLTVTPATPGTVPTGTVTVTSSQTGLIPLCTYSLAGGLTGSCTDSRLLTAQNNVTFTATYTGDANFGAVSGSTLTNVQKAATMTTVTPTPASPVYGQVQTFSVSVAPQIAGVVPTGTVTVTTPGVLQPLCTVTLVAGAGSCVSSANVPTATGIVYQATYSGDPNFLASTGTSSGNVVGQATSATTLVLSSASSAYGAEGAQVFTATVTPEVSGAPTGSVAVKAGTATVCTITLVDGTGTCSPAATALGPSGTPYAMTGVYGGDADFTGSVSAVKPWTITSATVGLSASVSTSTVIFGNEAVALFSATVTAPGAGTPTGTVVFKTGPATLCTATVDAGQASCALAVTLGVDGSPYAVSATYSGDANFAGTSVSTISLTVVKASTALALSITGNPTVYGNEHAPVFTVTASPQFAGSPTGTVALTAGTTALCTVTLTAGTGSCQLASPTLVPAGSYTVVASYGGDTNFTGSGAFGFLTVSQAATAAAVSFTPSSLTVGAETAGRFTPTLTLTPSPNGTPSGLVTVTATATATDVATALCSMAAGSATGATSCSPASTTLLAPGTYTVSVAYPGDQNFGASSGAAAGPLTVTQAPTSALSLSLTASTGTVTYGNEQSVTYGVSFGSAVPAPTGPVTVKTGTMTLCTVTLSAGTGSCTIASPTAVGVSATNPVVAAYSRGRQLLGHGHLDRLGQLGRDPGLDHHRRLGHPDLGHLRGRERGGVLGLGHPRVRRHPDRHGRRQDRDHHPVHGHPARHHLLDRGRDPARGRLLGHRDLQR